MKSQRRDSEQSTENALIKEAEIEQDVVEPLQSALIFDKVKLLVESWNES